MRKMLSTILAAAILLSSVAAFSCFAEEATLEDQVSITEIEKSTDTSTAAESLSVTKNGTTTVLNVIKNNKGKIIAIISTVIVAGLGCYFGRNFLSNVVKPVATTDNTSEVIDNVTTPQLDTPVINNNTSLN